MIIAQGYPLWVAYDSRTRPPVEAVIAWDYEPGDVSRPPVPITASGPVESFDRIIDTEAAMLRLRKTYEDPARGEATF